MAAILCNLDGLDRHVDGLEDSFFWQKSQHIISRHLATTGA